MTNSEDNLPPAVGAYWIKEEDYPALLQLFDDGPKIPPHTRLRQPPQGARQGADALPRHDVDPRAARRRNARRRRSDDPRGGRPAVSKLERTHVGRWRAGRSLADRRPGDQRRLSLA